MTPNATTRRPAASARFRPRPSRRIAGLLLAGLTWTAGPAAAQEQSFAAWLDGFRREAISLGISPGTLDRTLGGVQPSQRVVELDQHQPEFTRPVWEYLDGALSASRVERGREMLSRHGGLLGRIARQYGVPERYLVAFWGLETSYGSNLGDFNIPQALATLAWEGRRAAFGREQLLAALRIIETDRVAPQAMVGSWAGAMGQMQFIPTTYVAYAVDGDGDGRRDLWSSVPDALSSGANYLKEMGWHEDELWGREVRLPRGFDYTLADQDNKRSVTDWAAMGVTRANGQPLPTADVQGAILLPAGHRGPAFLVYDNFDVIMRWNRSTSYALAVGLLADRLAGRPGVAAAWPRDERPLSRSAITEMQQLLTRLGHDPGGVDGMAGPNTRAALRSFQQSVGLVPDGFPTESVMQRLRAAAG